MPAPIAPEIPHELNAHGDKRVDPYFWMKDRADPAVIQHLEAENAFVEERLAPVAPLRAAVLEELKARIPPADQSLPFLLRGFEYYRRFTEGKEYPVYCRRAVGGVEEVLVDVNKLAVGHEFTEAHFPDPSPDSTKIMYAADFEGRRFYTLFVKDLATGAIIAEVPLTTGNAEWANDSRTIFFSRQDPETLRSCEVHRYELGGASELVYEEADETFDVSVAKSRDDSFLFIASSATVSNEWRFLAAGNPRGNFSLFLEREADHEYALEWGGDAFYVLTNWKAQNFRLMRAPLTGGSREGWTEVVPHRADTLLEGVSFFQGHYALSERRDGQTVLAVVLRASGERREIAFPDPVYVAGFDANPEYGADFLRYRYESMHRPASLYDYSVATTESVLRKTQKVPTYDSSLYASERLLVKARDGVEVPVSLVYRRSTPRNGTAPLFLYAYGSYGMSMEPWFQSDVVSLLDRGFIYAIAHVRGGSEMGRHWYEDGKLLRKLNTFRDFVDVTVALGKICDPSRVYASGASAGGLLMGAIVNDRPELYRGVLAGVPFVDVLTTMLDDTIPLTTGEYDEWGNPNEKEAYYYMKQYSPYDNLGAHKYPALLITAGFHDSQVQYWEPAKWAAKLRKAGADVLLFTEMGAGHGGASGRYRALEQTALEHAFVLQLEGFTA
jgi:oligopeptidase B